MFVLFSVVACKKLSSFNYPTSVVSAYDILLADDNYSYFRYISQRAGLQSLLQGDGAFTIFVPTNSAFLNSGYTFKSLQDMPDPEITLLAKNHILSNKLDIKSTGIANLTTLSNSSINLQTIGSSIFVDGGDVLNANELATNGYINIINKVLISKITLSKAIEVYTNGTSISQLTFAAAAIARASTGGTDFNALLMGSTPYTFFIPNNGAFIDGGYASIAAINAANPVTLTNILKYHFIPGANLTTAFDSTAVTSYNGIPLYFDKVVKNRGGSTSFYANGITFGNSAPSNILATNGVMHVISRFLPAPITTNTLVRINSDVNLSTFSALIQRASTADPNFNFSSLLSDPNKSYTVFAVNNAGLLAAGYPNVAAINAADPSVLANIMKLHMIPKRINNIGSGGAATLLTYVNPITSVASPIGLTFVLTPGFSVKGPSNIATIPVITGNVVTTNGILNIIGTVLTP